MRKKEGRFIIASFIIMLFLLPVCCIHAGAEQRMWEEGTEQMTEEGSTAQTEVHAMVESPSISPTNSPTNIPDPTDSPTAFPTGTQSPSVTVSPNQNPDTGDTNRMTSWLLLIAAAGTTAAIAVICLRKTINKT